MTAITPVEPYTSDDLNWTNSSSRVSREHDDESLRDIALTEITPADWDSYDTVLIGA
ncbi:MAG: flavodoxin [Waltera sp.]|uniref:flavodoxin n=1 Tax=Acetatifactor sp. TaxID=1872090 RepID=UPI0039FB4B79